MSLLFEVGAHISFFTEDQQEMEESISGLKAGGMNWEKPTFVYLLHKSFTICCVCFCAR